MRWWCGRLGQPKTSVSNISHFFMIAVGGGVDNDNGDDIGGCVGGYCGQAGRTGILFVYIIYCRHAMNHLMDQNYYYVAGLMAIRVQKSQKNVNEYEK